MSFLVTAKLTIRDVDKKNRMASVVSWDMIVKRVRMVNLFSKRGFVCEDFICLRVQRQFETSGSAPERFNVVRGVFARKINVVR